jgi:hypothetical protein
MAEVDMDIDTSHTLGVDALIDEDLIDYDSDAEGAAGEAIDITQVYDGQAEHTNGGATLHPDAVIDTAEPAELDGEEEPRSSHTEANDGTDEGTFDESAQPADDTLNNVVAMDESTEHDPGHIADEIDFDYADEQEDKNNGQSAEGGASHPPDSETGPQVNDFDFDTEDGTAEGAATLVVEDEVAEKTSDHNESHVETQSFDHSAAHTDEVRDEITWEENEEADNNQTPNPMDLLSASGASVTNEVSESSHLPNNDINDDASLEHDVENPEELVDTEDVEASQFGDGAEGDADATQDQELDEKNDGKAAQQDESADGQQSLEASDSEFPRITVQYRGDEYPCFAHTSEGFFSDLTVVDATMATVLEGFRKELHDEIAPEDELVIQVDELGLEFTESSVQENLSNITLRQVLEIFDLLVKNQDPDKTRTLYTYLFTKPSTIKRFESLAESAAAGRGLNEVIYHFESPITHGQTTADEQDNTFAYEDVHDYDSTVEESGEGANEIQEDAEDDNDTTNREETPLQQPDSVEDVEDVEDVGDVGDVGDFDHYADDKSHQVTDTVGDQVDDSELIVGQTVTVDSTAQLENDGNLLSLDAETSFETGPVEVDEAWQGNDSVNEPQAIDTGTAATSTTSTMNETLTAVHADDFDLNVTDDHPEFHDTEDMAEIDWRDDPTQVEADITASQGTTKRNRIDDEPDVDEQQDVKRRRSN